jgi:hypothetical protein
MVPFASGDPRAQRPFENSDAGLQMAFGCAPMLSYDDVRSASVLAKHHFRRGLANFQTVSQHIYLFLPLQD